MRVNMLFNSRKETTIQIKAAFFQGLFKKKPTTCRSSYTLQERVFSNILSWLELLVVTKCIAPIYSTMIFNIMRRNELVDNNKTLLDKIAH